MHIPDDIHPWDVTPDEAAAIQRALAERVRLRFPVPANHDGKPIPEADGNPVEALRYVRYVAGVDSAFPGDGTICLACVVLWDRVNRETVETAIGTAPVLMPYVPGFLSFREAPAVLEALRALSRVPDALLCDGQGTAHPRRLGIASHLGVLLDIPSAGCAKSRLFGFAGEPEPERGSRRTLRAGKETVGAVLRTKTGVKPVYVSAGHLMSHTDAVALVLACDGGYRLPEPTRLADILASEKRKTFR